MSGQTKTFGPYSPVRQGGSLYFTAGHTGANPSTKMVNPDVKIQTAAALDALAQTLASVGLTLDDVIKTTVFVADMDDLAAVNEAYMTRFKEPRPARSTVAVKELPRIALNGPLLIEIEAVAARQGV